MSAESNTEQPEAGNGDTPQRRASDALEPQRIELEVDNPTRRVLAWLGLAFVILIVDQYTKALVIDNMVLYQRIPVVPMFDFVRLHNTGAAFSFLADAGGWQQDVFISMAILICTVMLWWLWILPAKDHRVLACGIALILSGAIGNVIDRFLHGYVVDFLLVYYGTWSYPAFNVADSAITCGVVLVLFDSFFLEKKRIAKGHVPKRRATDPD